MCINILFQGDQPSILFNQKLSETKTDAGPLIENLLCEVKMAHLSHHLYSCLKHVIH